MRRIDLRVCGRVGSCVGAGVGVREGGGKMKAEMAEDVNASRDITSFFEE